MDNIYFAAKEGKDTASILVSKSQSWANCLEANFYLQKLRMTWAAYHGCYFASFSDSHQITFGGEQGELTNIAINHFRNLGQHMLVMTTSNRPSLEARATNTDYKSLVQTNLANGLLDYYMREKRMEKYLKTAVEYAIVLGAGYVKMGWNATSGEIFDYNEETGVPIYQGDAEFSNLSPFDVIFDTTKENQKHDWYNVRTFKNRFDLMAKFPEFSDKISGVAAKDSLKGHGVGVSSVNNNETDDIAVWEFYHNRTEAMPNGRYMLFVGDDVVLMDTPLPYREIPIYRIAPSDILGTPFGYTPMFDLLPIQEGINNAYSTIMTNQNAFGTQNIIVPRGADININTLAGGLNIIECNTQVGMPSALNLTSTPTEIFSFLELLEKSIETISGINSIARGNAPTNLKSGNALALIQSMAIQFMSGLQQQYVELVEDVGTGLINMLKDFAAVPRIAAIVGKNNRTYMQEFKGDDLSDVNRVLVDLGNAMARTTAGRVQMAEQMLQMQLIKNPEQYFQVINTGKLDVMTEGTTSQLLLTKGENEAMISGKKVPVLITDNHKMHIDEHSSILADPHLREDAQLVTIVLGHIQEHIGQLQYGDPNLLALLGQKALSPPGGTPVAPQGAPNMPSQGAPQSLGPEQSAGEANTPNLPQVDASLLPNPGLQDASLGNVKLGNPNGQ